MGGARDGAFRARRVRAVQADAGTDRCGGIVCFIWGRMLICRYNVQAGPLPDPRFADCAGNPLRARGNAGAGRDGGVTPG